MLNHIKSFGFCGQSLKITIFILGSLLFSLSSGDPKQVDKPVNESKAENPYFLDLDTLQSLRERRRFQELMYMEKKDPRTAWIAFRIKSWSSDYYSAVAGVVAAELHRRIDKNAVVPPTKFVIIKSEDGHYSLIGYVYQEISFATPIERMVDSQEPNDFVNHMIHKDHNIERSISIWNCLGLPTSPVASRLAVFEDNRLIRYDYHKAFSYEEATIRKRCFRTSLFVVSEYQCDVEYIKNLKQNLRTQHYSTLQTVISEIRAAASQYLTESEQDLLNRTLERILTKFQC